MPEYRAYLIGQDGHFIREVALDYPDDISAAAAAQRHVDANVVELCPPRSSENRDQLLSRRWLSCSCQFDRVQPNVRIIARTDYPDFPSIDFS
jgi:hypothetical protein